MRWRNGPTASASARWPSATRYREQPCINLSTTSGVRTCSTISTCGPILIQEKIILTSLRRANILKLNEDEAAEIAAICALPASDLPDIGRALIEQYQLAYCVITLGERGVLALSAAGELCYVPTYQINW